MSWRGRFKDVLVNLLANAIWAGILGSLSSSVVITVAVKRLLPHLRLTDAVTTAVLLGLATLPMTILFASAKRPVPQAQVGLVRTALLEHQFGRHEKTVLRYILEHGRIRRPGLANSGMDGAIIASTLAKGKAANIIHDQRDMASADEWFWINPYFVTALDSLLREEAA